MGEMSIVHWMIVIAVVVLLFGRGKISGLMEDVANGIKSFRKGMKDDEPVSAGSASGAKRTAEIQRPSSDDDINPAPAKVSQPNAERLARSE